MSMVRFAVWEEFLNELAFAPPRDRVVHLTFSVRYTTRPSSDLTMLAWCETRKNWIAFVDNLDRMPDDRSDEFAARVESLLVERKRQLEALGFFVSPGRTRARPDIAVAGNS